MFEGAMGNPRGALYAGSEGGGTKFVCAVAYSPVDHVQSIVIPATTCQTTLNECVCFLRAVQELHGPIASIGFGCFGPMADGGSVLGRGLDRSPPSLSSIQGDSCIPGAVRRLFFYARFWFHPWPAARLRPPPIHPRRPSGWWSNRAHRRS